MMNLYEAIGCRHSVRKYTDREVTEKLRGQILSYFEYHCLNPDPG